MKKVWKIILVGFLTTIFRICAQLLIPASDSNGLTPSVFVKNGTFELVFTVYAILVYTLIAAMFLIIRNNLNGSKIMQGLKYGLAFSVIWVVYLLEPLPHVIASAHSVVTVLSYPIADGIGLIVLGLLVGALLGETRPSIAKKKTKCVIPIVIITSCFVIGRVLQYYVFNLNSSIHINPLLTMVWTISIGLVSSCVMVYFNQYIAVKNRVSRAILLGGIMFGLNLLLFNCFMFIVAEIDIADIGIRTVVDMVAVSVGCFFVDSNNEQLS